MTKEEAIVAISEKVKEAEAALSVAEGLAEEHGIEFSFSPAYGMGGYFQDKNQWSESNSNPDWGWESSSANC